MKKLLQRLIATPRQVFNLTTNTLKIVFGVSILVGLLLIVGLLKLIF